MRIIPVVTLNIQMHLKIWADVLRQSVNDYAAMSLFGRQASVS